MGAMVSLPNLRLIGLFFLIFFISFVHAAPASINNTDISSILFCENRLCCRSSKWTDYLTFYVFNYLAHVGTTRTRPGQSTLGSLLIMMAALLVPMSGALRGVRAITSKAMFAITDLQTAARAGALCMVIHVPGNDVGEQVVNGFTTKIHGRCKLPSSYFLITVPGNAIFIEDEVASNDFQNNVWKKTYSAVFNSVADVMKPQQKVSTYIVCSSNVLKSFIAVLQAIFAFATLYNSKGRQIDRFGFAAFGFTVVPYALMSVINLFANLLCPEYPAMYLVSNRVLQNLQHQYSLRSSKDNQNQVAQQTDTQQDAGIAEHHVAQQDAGTAEQNVLQQDTEIAEQEKQGNLQADSSAEDGKQLNQAQRARNDHKDQTFEISGIVGTLSPESDRVITAKLDRMISNMSFRGDKKAWKLGFDRKTENHELLVYFVIVGLILGIIGGLSRFHKGSSTLAEQVWTMMWLGFGILFAFGIVQEELEEGILNHRPSRAPSQIWNSFSEDIFSYILVGVPAIGGFVVVGQMINSYGTCHYV